MSDEEEREFKAITEMLTALDCWHFERTGFFLSKKMWRDFKSGKLIVVRMTQDALLVAEKRKKDAQKLGIVWK